MAQEVEKALYFKPPGCDIPVTLYDFGCECTAPTNEVHRKEATDAYAQDAEAFLQRACGDNGVPADADYLHALSIDIVARPLYRSVALFEKLLSMVVRGYLLPPEEDALALKPCPWERPLIGIVNMVTAINTQNAAGPEDSAILQRFGSAQTHQQAVAVIKQDLPRLLLGGEHADHLRITVAKLWTLLKQYDPVEHHHPDSELAELLTIVLLCWTNMSFVNRSPTMNKVITDLYGFVSRDSDDCQLSELLERVHGERLEHAASVIGIKTLQRRFTTWLQDPDAINERLLSELVVLEGFIYDGITLCSRSLSSSDLPLYIQRALVRQIRLSQDETTLDIMDLGLRLLALSTTWSGGNADIRRRTEVLLQGDIVGLAIAALRLFIIFKERPHKTPFKGTGWHWLFQHLNKGLTGYDGTTLSPEIAVALTRTLEHYLPYMRDPIYSREEGSAAGAYAREVLERLSTICGITYDSAEQNWLRRHECNAMVCPNRSPKKVKTKQCGGCQQARYCSVECQATHWAEHKSKCPGRKPVGQ